MPQTLQSLLQDTRLRTRELCPLRVPAELAVGLHVRLFLLEAKAAAPSSASLCHFSAPT